MKKYNPDAECIKCGGGDIEDVYCEEFNPDEREPYVKVAKMIGQEINPTPERIARTCKNCGYLWHELPMDGKSELDKGIDRMIDLAAKSAGMTREELLKPFPSADTPVIEVGDVVTVCCPTGGLEKVVLWVGLMTAMVQYKTDIPMEEKLSDLTLIRKGPKVHSAKGLVKDWQAYDEGKHVAVNICIEGEYKDMMALISAKPITVTSEEDSK